MTEIELNKACDAYCLVCKEWDTDCFEYCKGLPGKAECDAIRDFRKAMEGISGNKEEIPSNSCNSDKNLQELTWQDIADIIVAYGYVPKLNKDGSVRPAEDIFKDTLKRFKEGNK